MKTVTLLFFITCTALSFLSQASGTHDEHQAHNEQEKQIKNEEHSEHNKHQEGTTKIAAAMAEKVGINTAIISAQTLQITRKSYGRLTTGPEQTSHIRARFPGIIKSVHVSIGDNVKVGDLLAIVESNDSLKRYNVRASIAGTIIQRHANAGEMTQAQILFSIANFDNLWAHLQIFPALQSQVSIGQTVYIQHNNQTISAKIAQLLPANANAPYIIARVKLSNTSKQLFPGLLITGNIETQTTKAKLAVNNKALQTMENKVGVFIKQGDEYKFTPLTLGQHDQFFTEVLSGITANTEYVVENSYLIKADIAKSEAEHAH